MASRRGNSGSLFEAGTDMSGEIWGAAPEVDATPFCCWSCPDQSLHGRAAQLASPIGS
jgi:hypothetical protein